MTLNAGQLDREFILQRPFGVSPDEYEDVDTVWGAIRLIRGSEAVRFVTPQAQGRFVVTIRYREDLEASWRLTEVLTGRSLQIDNFGDPDGRLEQLQVFCVEAQ